MSVNLSTSTVLAVAFVALAVRILLSNTHRRPNAPGIGYGKLPIIGTWQGVFAFMKDPHGVMAEGCRKYRGGYFRVSSHTVEYLMVTDKERIAEYLAAPEDVLSFHDMIKEFLQVEWTLGYGVAHRPYHIPLVRTKLTQTIAGNVPSMLAEIRAAIHSLIGAPKEWTSFTLYKVMVGVVARVSNNAFSGLEFCRNEEFLDVAIEYAQGVVISAEILRLFPQFLKPYVVWFTPFARVQRQARALMGPYVQSRLDMDWDGKERPKDMIQFLIDAAPDVERTMPQIVERMMTLNMASIHTTTMTVTAAIAFLASKPEYIPELRAEVIEHSVNGELDKNSLLKLAKLDSFLRECGRVEPLGNIALVRRARKDFTFSDGTLLPANCSVATPIALLQNEASDLVNPEEFDGFRYSRMNTDSTGPTKFQMVNTDLTYLLFGHGKHACPGRFLAVTELKLILATLLLEYDMKTLPGSKPKNSMFATAKVPDTNFPILVKVREAGTSD